MDLDLDKLATAAATATIKEIVSGGISAGQGIWAWIKGKASVDEIKEIETGPDKPSAPDKVKALLKDMLHENPELQRELAELLQENGGPSVQQLANVSGEGNIAGQQSGDHNTINIQK